MCVPSNYTGLYIKCNSLRNKEKQATNLPVYRPLPVLGHSATIVQPNNLPGLTVLYSVTANNLPGHTSTSINGHIIYLATTQRRAASQIIYTTHTWYRRQTHVLSNPATTPLHSRSRRQWRDPVGSPKVNVDLYYFPKYFRK